MAYTKVVFQHLISSDGKAIAQAKSTAIASDHPSDQTTSTTHQTVTVQVSSQAGFSSSSASSSSSSSTPKTPT